MRFKTKDLLITVLPEGGEIRGQPAICRCTAQPTYCLGCTGSPTNQICQPTYWEHVLRRPVGFCVVTKCANSIIVYDQLRTPEEFAQVREELLVTVRQLEAIETQLEQRPQTLEEAEALETRLKNALEEIRVHKRSLGKKG
jgi:hypothetical protein